MTELQAATSNDLPSETPAPGAGRRRAWIAFALIAVALGFLVFRGLGDAAVYFLTADEAVAQREALGDRRFRVEGLVVAGTVSRTDSGVSFRIREGGATVEVDHQGDPPELFQPGIPVVLEGHWQGRRFASDRILVRHTEEYRAENPERVERYEGVGADTQPR
ncbi:MAG TPA: cytochrome c maturation protein CcmE [Acidimicrobiales bacterium]|nr:cytochrome c maturation protein CcmE [Acidimicrobiales bacterium]